MKKVKHIFRIINANEELACIIHYDYEIAKNEIEKLAKNFDKDSINIIYEKKEVNND